MTRNQMATAGALLLLGLTSNLAPGARGADAAEASWKDRAISPVANPLFFESPLIQSEVRPLFLYHKIDDEFIGGFARDCSTSGSRWI